MNADLPGAGRVPWLPFPTPSNWLAPTSFSLGDWVDAGFPDNYGRPVCQLREVRIDALIAPELDAKGRVDASKQAYVDLYRERLEQGESAPPVRVLETYEGRLRLVDGHRRMAAAASIGRSTIAAWVSPLIALPDAYGGSDLFGLTAELATRHLRPMRVTDTPFPEQIKSAIGNIGAFDPEDPRISFQRSDATRVQLPVFIGGPEHDPRGNVDVLRQRAHQVRARTEALTAGWPVSVHVVDTPHHLPPAVRAHEGFAVDQVDAVYAHGVIFVVASRVRNDDELQRLLAHEAVGHFGVEAIVGPERFERLLQQIEAARRAGGHADLFVEVERRYEGMDRRTQAREAIAVFAERAVRTDWLSEIWAAVRTFVRDRLRLPIAFNEADLAALVVSAARHLGRATASSAPHSSVSVYARSSAAPVWRSALNDALQPGGSAPPRAPVAEWKGWLDGAQRRGEFRKSERDWAGVDAWLALQPGTVSREGLLEQMANMQINVQTTVLGVQSRDGFAIRRNPQRGGWDVRDPDGQWWGGYQSEADARRAAPGLGAPAKYNRYVVAGGADYRELLLTLPTQADGSNYRGPYWDHSNVLVHVRFDERTSADGRRRLFMHEIQSDWHQQGLRDGYATNGPARVESLLVQETIFARFDAGEITCDQRNVALLEMSQKRDQMQHAGVPSAPLRKTGEWVLLAIKRMVRWAADEGFDQIAWATGDQAAGIFQLSQHVEQLVYQRRTGGSYQIIGVAGEDVREMADCVPPAELRGLVGKEIAERIIAGDGRSIEGYELLNADAFCSPLDTLLVLEGPDLRIGGDGLRAFYDRIVPATVQSWARGMGGSIDTTDSGHVLSLTPAMLAAAPDGHPVFCRSVPAEERAAALAAWLGASKVVTPGGTPLVVWHGSGSDVESFRQMAWCSEDATLAETYAALRQECYGGKAVLMPLYLRIEQPFDADAALPDVVTISQVIAEILRQAEAIGTVFDEDAKRAISAHWAVLENGRRIEESGPHYSRHNFWCDTPSLFGAAGAAALKDIFLIAGFDGIAMVEQGTRTWGAFSPLQVKSASGNTGGYHPQDPRIVFARGDSLRESAGHNAADAHSAQRAAAAPRAGVSM